MRVILNLLLTFTVFWIGTTYFNENIYIEDTKTLIVATLIMFGISILFTWLFALSILLIPVGIGCITSIILFIFAFVLTPIKLLLLDRYLPGFEINGFWTFVILTIILSIFTIKKTTVTKEE